jgi:alpha-L-fucosidase
MKRLFTLIAIAAGIVSCDAWPALAGDYGEKYEDYPVDAGYRHASPEALEAWRDRKYGMRIVWGVYSMLGVQASWPLAGASGPFRAKYQALYQEFNPTDFVGDRWAELMQRCGFRYFTFVAKHHDGFAMWDTRTKVKKRFVESGPKAGQIEDCDLHYDIMETPFGRDILKELVDATRKRGISTGLYFSHADWYDADFRLDRWNPHRDASYSRQTEPEGWKRFVARHREQVRELLTNYGKVDQFEWDLCFPESAWPDVVETVKLARRLQPDVLMRDRGIGRYGDIMTPEMWIPQANPDQEPAKGQGQTVDRPWQVIYNMAGIASYDPIAENYKSAEWILSALIDTVAKGGNFMPMLGPDAQGSFHPVAVDRLEQVGRWLEVNGEAIFKTRPCRTWNDGENVRYTRSKDNRFVYAISRKWPGRELTLREVRAREGSPIRMLGVDQPLVWRQDRDALVIGIPEPLQDERRRPCGMAYAFRIEPTPPAHTAGSAAVSGHLSGLGYEGPGLARQVVPVEVLCHPAPVLRSGM